MPGYNPPFALFVLDTVNLFIHEAGHLFFKPFGMTIYILGGSVFQVLLPLTLAVVTARQNILQVGWPAFWTGESLVNVSAYILDAPYRNGDADVSEPLGQLVFWTGILLCAASIGAGVWAAIKTYREGGLT